MLARTLPTRVDQDQRFYHAGRTYVLATPEERRRHPGNGRDCVLAYLVPEKGDRVPVTFNPLEPVYVNQK